MKLLDMVIFWYKTNCNCLRNKPSRRPRSPINETLTINAVYIFEIGEKKSIWNAHRSIISFSKQNKAMWLLVSLRDLLWWLSCFSSASGFLSYPSPKRQQKRKKQTKKPTNLQIYQTWTRWSGDVIRSTGKKNFNAVSHNRTRPYFWFNMAEARLDLISSSWMFIQ